MDALPERATNKPQFAVINVAELLERLAYYGFTSVFALSLDARGYTGSQIGIVAAILLAFPYIVPLVSSAIGEKVGYRLTMLVALATYLGGFGVLASVDSFGGIVVGAALVAAGAGGFKPITAATIAHVTSEKHRSLGFTVYYTGINVGAFFGPVLVALVTDDYRTASIVSGAAMAVTFALILVAFRNPTPPRSDTSMVQAFAKLGSIFRDTRLLLLLAAFSGFWFLYSMNFSFLPLFLDSFVERPEWFKTSLQQSYNPLIVMVLGIPLGAFATRFDPRRMMAAGVVLYIVGFSIVGFVTHVAGFFVGLFIATVGEILAYPAFLAYVARIAPPDRIAIYQSFGFLPLFIGFFFGPLAVGAAYDALAIEAARPALFWAIPIAVGVLALAGILANTPREADAATRKRAFASAAAALLLLPVLAGAAFAFGGKAPQDVIAEPPVTAGLERVDLAGWDGTLSEGEETLLPLVLPMNATGNVTLRLTWTDEATQAGPAGENQPDAFELTLLGLNDTVIATGLVENTIGQEGEIAFAVPAAQVPLQAHVRVKLVSAGDDAVAVPLAGPTTVQQDTSNAWVLEGTAEVPASTAS